MIRHLTWKRVDGSQRVFESACRSESVDPKVLHTSAGLVLELCIVPFVGALLLQEERKMLFVKGHAACKAHTPGMDEDFGSKGLDGKIVATRQLLHAVMAQVVLAQSDAEALDRLPEDLYSRL